MLVTGVSNSVCNFLPFSGIAEMYHLQRLLSPRHHSHYVIILLLIPSSYFIYNYNVLEYSQTVPFIYFQYPLELDMKALVDSILREERPAADQITDDNFPIILDNDKMCKSEDGEDEIHFILFVIKSSMENTERRQMIRRTWGQEYLIPYSSTKRIFVLGIDPAKGDLQQKIAQEHQENQDIVQGYFKDNFGNSTYKILTGMRWALSNCKGARYIVFVDDDYFISTFNLVSYLNEIPMSKYSDLYMGHVHEFGMPSRIRDSELYVSLTDYPFRYWPPYIETRCFVVSPVMAERLYIASHYTKFLRIPDAFFGIVAWKLKAQLQQNPHIYTTAAEAAKLRLVEKRFSMIEISFEHFCGSLTLLD